jgi:hypothetical protein
MTIHRRHILAMVGSAALLATTAPARTAIGDDDPLAQCIAANDKGLDLRKQGKLLEARRALAGCAASTCGSDISGACQKRISEITAALPSIVFLPKDGAGHDMIGVKMTVDGAPTSVVLDGRPVPVDPGPHSFRFEADGVEPTTRSFVLAEGAKDRQERIDMGPPPSAATPGGATPTGAPSSGGSSGQRTIGWVVGGVGVAGVAAGAVFGLLAMSKWSASKNDCSTATSCPNVESARSEHDDASTFGNVSTATFAVGGVGLAVGAVLLLTAPQASPTVGVGPVRFGADLGPGVAGLSMNGVFR